MSRFRAWLIVAVLWLSFWAVSEIAYAAGGDTHCTEAESYSHCLASKATWEAWAPAGFTAQCLSKPGGVSMNPAGCGACVSVGSHEVHKYYYGSYAGLKSTSEPGYTFHDYCTETPDCEAGQSIPGASWPVGSDTTHLCDGNCAYAATGVVVCGALNCYGDLVSTGVACGELQIGGAPEGCTIQGGVIVCDCIANPGAPFCPGGDDHSSDNCITDPVTGEVTCLNDKPKDTPHDEGPPESDEQPDGSGDSDGDGVPNDEDHDHPTGPGNEQPCIPGVNCEDPNKTSTSSGSCDVPPECSGPATECAILNQIWRSNCAAYDVGDAKPPWVDDPDWGRDLKRESEKIDVGRELDASGIGGGSCPANPVIDVLGSSVVLDVSGICDAADIVRLFVILAGWLSAAYIIYRSF